ncbi:MAG: alpha/beta hydrolase [Campylobacterales bacterium]|nr:alpha/beta hydrolase [Campylobacterales bacterium]
MRYLIFLLLSFVFAWTLHATEFNSYKLTSEAELKENYLTTISPYFYQHKIHYFYTKESLKIAYKIFEVKDAKASIVISSGRTEGMVKYQELIYDLNNNGYSVYILDHRGQGYSQRLLDDLQIGHVNDFFNYVRDLKYFVDKVVPQNQKKVLLAHSMGGAIASLYLESYPRDFDALVLSSPMHQPSLLGNTFSGALCRFIENRTNDLQEYMIGMHSYDETKHAFKNNNYTHSEVRYDIMRDAYEREPLTKIGGASAGWLVEACKWSKLSVQNASEIQIPVLLLQAQRDKIVTSGAQVKFCKNLGTACELKVIKEAYHELFIEQDIYREEALKAILEFLTKTLH